MALSARIIRSVARTSAAFGMRSSLVRVAPVFARQVHVAVPTLAGTADDESHDDFKPRINAKTAAKSQGDSGAISSPEAAVAAIDKAVNNNPVVLFMKGTPQNPQCGFSQQVVRVLQSHSVSFGSVNVLANEHIRQGIKEFSNWPTIPQLYVNGEFIGGCDIVTSMHQNGELAEVLEEVATGTTEN